MAKNKQLDPQNWHDLHNANLSPSAKISLKVTTFAGTLRFVYYHLIWWTIWFLINSSLFHLTFDHYPYNLLTMILSLEAILLGTFILIGQNLQAARDKAQAEHQYKHQELELLAIRKINETQTEMLDILLKDNPSYVDRQALERKAKKKVQEETKQIKKNARKAVSKRPPRST